MRSRVALAAACLALAAACGGGGGSPTTPAPPPPTVPVSSACGALTQSVSPSTAIVNGAECSTDNSAVVLLNIKDASGAQAGSCSGTIIAARAVLTLSLIHI